MTRIKAAVCHEFGAPLKVETVELRPPRGTEVEVILGAVAICHSDISLAEGGWGGQLPAVFGHEAAGRISAVGDAVADHRVGDAVLVTLIRACGTCPACASGRPVLCEADQGGSRSPIRGLDGAPIHHGLACAAFAERVVVERSQIARLPADMPPDAACLLACGVITGIGAVVNSAGLRAGQDVVVIGAGGVGLNAIQGARICGARRIVAVDRTEAKLEDARAFGATDVVLAGEAPWALAREMTGRGADAVLVTAGAISAYQSAPRYLAPGGRLVMVGMPHSGAEMSLEPVDFAALGQAMIGSRMGDTVLARDVPWLVDLHRQGRLKLDELISGRWSLEGINEAIADTKAGSARRNVITF